MWGKGNTGILTKFMENNITEKAFYQANLRKGGVLRAVLGSTSLIKDTRDHIC